MTSADLARLGSADAAALRQNAKRSLIALLLRSRWVHGFVLPAALLCVWEAAVRAGILPARTMPPPSRVVATLAALAETGELSTHVGATLGRVMIGFALGAGAGTLLGALTGASASMRRLVDPLIQSLRAVPSLAWVPLFILWLGIFEGSKVALIAVGVFFPTYLGVMGAITAVDRSLIDVGRMFCFSRWAMLRKIYLPAIAPAWVLSLRSGLGLGFMFVVAAELMGASEGLGYLLIDGEQLGKADQIIAAIVAFAVLGKICDSLLMLAAAPLLRWQKGRR
jgi:sulfonate transport system permease protein